MTKKKAKKQDEAKPELPPRYSYRSKRVNTIVTPGSCSEHRAQVRAARERTAPSLRFRMSQLWAAADGTFHRNRKVARKHCPNGELPRLVRL